MLFVAASENCNIFPIFSMGSSSEIVPFGIDESTPLFRVASFCSVEEDSSLHMQNNRGLPKVAFLRSSIEGDVEQGQLSSSLCVKFPPHQTMTEESRNLLRNGFVLGGLGTFMVLLVGLHKSIQEIGGATVAKIAGPAGTLFMLWGAAFIGGPLYALWNHQGTQLEIGEDTFTYRSFVYFGKGEVHQGPIGRAEIAIIAQHEDKEGGNGERNFSRIEWMWGAQRRQRVVLWRSQDLQELVAAGATVQSFLMEVLVPAGTWSDETDTTSSGSSTDSEIE